VEGGNISLRKTTKKKEYAEKGGLQRTSGPWRRKKKGPRRGFQKGNSRPYKKRDQKKTELRSWMIEGGAILKN